MMILLAALACSTDSVDGTIAFPKEFYGQDHQLSVVGVDDRCFDGAMNALFQPEGSQTTVEWPYPLYVPLLNELPVSYEVSFLEPFVGMGVTASAMDSDAIALGESLTEELSLGEPFGDCLATTSLEASIRPNGDHFAIEAIITMSDIRGDDVSCPVPSEDSCQIALSMKGVPWTE